MSNNAKMRRIIVGISGASGVIYGIRTLEALRETGIETHLVMSRTAQLTLACETDLSLEDVHALADVVHSAGNLGASISSGSFKTMGMIIAPCSIRSLGELASSVTSTLLTRAADVVLKQPRKLVLTVREPPLHGIHLRHMAALSDAGAVIAPPVPAFYQRPETIDDIVDHTVGRVLDLFEIEHQLVDRWNGVEKQPVTK